MECNFYIDNDRIYTPRDRKVTGTLSLTSLLEKNNIQSITFGLKSHLQLLPNYDSDGNITNAVVRNYHRHISTFPDYKDRLANRKPGESLNERDVYIVTNTIMDKVMPNNKLIKKPDGQWSFPANETIVLNFDLDFPSPLQQFLPSSCPNEYSFNDLHHHTVEVWYKVYVEVTRLSTFLKREKTDDFSKYVQFQSDVQFPTPLAILHFGENNIFKSKMPKTDLTNNGGFKSEDIVSTSRKPRFLRRFLNRKEGRNIPFVLEFDVQSLISLFHPLPLQFNIRFVFDFSQAKFPQDFVTEKSSSGLGLFQIESLKVKVRYVSRLAIEDDNGVCERPSKTVLDLKFQDLIFDMKNATFDPATEKGILEIPQDVFMSQLDLHLPLKEHIKQPIATSCMMFDFVQNSTTLEFAWTIIDTDNKIKLTFKTESTLSAEPNNRNILPFIDSAPAYNDVEKDGTLLVENEKKPF